MITENRIIDALCRHLENTGYEIEGKCYTNQRGIDIIASHPQEGLLFIEAKGEGSSRPTNVGQECFSRDQVNDHVGRGLLRILKICAAGWNTALVFPDNDDHTAEIQAIIDILLHLNIKIFFVNSTSNVREENGA